METAKVDIRKLQLLNDRINQCIDALNQVRLSVHGLGAQTGISGGGVGTGQIPGLEYGLGLSHSGIGQNPFSSIGQNPFSQIGQSPFSQIGQQNPFAQTPFGQPSVFPQVPTPFGFGQFGVNPYMSGLAHTSPESFRPMWADPLLTARIVQTFPYAQLPVPPVVSIY